MRAIGMDVHRDFCEVAIAGGGEVRSVGRVEATPAALEVFAASLGPADIVGLEVTGNSGEIARIIGRHVGRVVVVSPHDTGIGRARAKTDRLDARTLARLLAAGVSSMRCGCRMSGRARCAAGCRAAVSWCAHARGQRTRSTRC